jgi:acetyl-CoA carboxylase carboxyltransferase component
MAGRVVQVVVAVGEHVRAGDAVVVLEAMKMEHVVVAPEAGVVEAIVVAVGDGVSEDQAVATLRPEARAGGGEGGRAAGPDLDAVRADLAELEARLAATSDAGRPEAVARRRKTGQRTTRENLADLLDPGSFIEYGALALAAQRQRLPLEELIRQSPADGIVCGVGTVAGAPVMALAYDYTVMAGTQGGMGHKKLDRMLAIAAERALPVVLFAEGGGGRPSDTDMPWVAGLDTPSFLGMARLSGVAPLVGIVSGRCFAGNAALLGCCDLIIAAEDANIGMGGPAMIEGGGLGTFRPEEVGPIDVQSRNGVVDVRVADEAQAVAVAKRYLGYFGPPSTSWTCADQRALRAAVPEQRKRSYDVRAVIDTLADAGSVLELRREFGVAAVTALARLEGRAVGVVANDPQHLGGAIDADAADKIARFLQLCDAHGLPVVSLCDTPGFMVGPEAEKTALVRHVSRLFVVAGKLRVPYFTVVLRKGYGLGAQGMAGGHFHAPFFTVSWPSGEFGGMGLEGAVRLAMRKQLEAIADPAAREAMFRKMVEIAYERGKAINMASYLEIDGVIDPADTRGWLVRGLAAAGPIERGGGGGGGRGRGWIDTW